MVRATTYGACRDCAQPGFGGPGDNRFTAYAPICRGDVCRDPGYPQVFVNASDLTLFIRVTDLVFGGPAPAFSFERSYNMGDTRPGPFGAGWSFSLGDSLTTDTDDSLVLRRGSGRIDRFAPAAPSGSSSAFFAVTATTDTLAQSSDGTYTLRSPASTTTRVFSLDGRLLAIQDSGATRVSLNYDSSNRLTGASYRERSLTFSYDGDGHVTSISDSAGRSIGYSYTLDGRLAQQTNADGQTVAYQYDGSGNLVSMGYAGGQIAIAYSSDPPYTSVATVTTPDGAVRQYSVPNDPTQTQVTDGNGDATLYVSNPAGLLLSATDPAGNTISYTYDTSGRRIRTVDGNGSTASFAYDANGNLAGIADGSGNRWSADYTAARPAHITDPNGNIWAFQYDSSGNLVGVTNPAGGVVSAVRSASGQITGITDARGNKTSYQYDANGLIATFIDALNGNWSYQYDGAARAVARTDPGGSTLAAGYTTSNRITGLTAGNVQAAFDFSGIRRDSLNRLVSYTDSFGNQVAYTYDAAGQLTGMTLPGGNTVTYQYDHAHRLSQVSDWLGNFALYRYDAAGWPLSVTVSGGPIAVYQYDAAHNLRAIVSTGPDGSPVAGYRYTLDGNANRTAVSALEPFTAAVSFPAYSAAYDAANHPVTRSDGQSYTYDSRGNLTAIQGSSNVTLGYDPFGRLQSFNWAVLGAESSTTYGYDSTGLRVVRTVDGTARLFLYDLAGSRPRVVMEMDGSYTPIAWYVYGLGLLWKVAADSSTYFYHFDGDGNVVALSNPTGGVVNEYRYDPTGRLMASNEAVENMFRARGEAGWMDDGNGLVFTNSLYQFPELRLTLPATADPSPPSSDLSPPFPGAGTCFFQGVSNCLFATGGRER
jgi:YD repeat-containing protein